MQQAIFQSGYRDYDVNFWLIRKKISLCKMYNMTFLVVVNPYKSRLENYLQSLKLGTNIAKWFAPSSALKYTKVNWKYLR